MASSTCSRCGTTAGAGSRFCPACGSALTASAQTAEDLLLARLREATLGEYDVLRELGRGGMAAVYLAWDRELARHVAVKVLLPELAHHPMMSQRFLQEARTAANLDDHPNVVRVYRAKESQGLRYFVMKYVDGCSLDQLLRATGPLPVDLAAHLVDQIALALHYAHQRGVVHRDVKPGNVLLDRQGGVVVTDFGIAKVAEGDLVTRTGVIIGTPHYMAPEQWRVEPLTPATDQYALGVVAHELITGSLPFDGTHYEVQQAHLRATPPPIRTRDGVAPGALGDVVGLMLAKQPDERFPDLASVSRALGVIPRDPTPTLRLRLSRLIPAAAPLGPPGAPGAGTPGAGMPAVSPPPAGTPAAGARAGAPVRGDALVPALGATAVRSASGGFPPYGPPPYGALATTDTPADETGDMLADTAPTPTAWAGAGGRLTPTAESQLLSRTDAPLPPPRRRPWRPSTPAVAVGGLVAAFGVAALLTRGDRAAGVPAAAPAAVVSAAPAAGTAPALRGVPAVPAPLPTAMVDSAAGATVPALDDSAALVAGAVGGDSASPLPAALLIAGAPPSGRLTLAAGDSVRLRARVNNAAGVRLADAVVRWTSSDSARVALRNGWVVGVAAGGDPVVVAAASEGVSRAVRVTVGPAAPTTRAVAAGTVAAAGPTDAEVQRVVREFVSALGARDVDELSRRLAPLAGDNTPSRDFVDWVRGARRLAVDAPAAGAVETRGGTARVAVRVPMRWGRGGLLGSTGRGDATFWVALRHEGGAWRGGEVTLASRFGR